MRKWLLNDEVDGTVKSVEELKMKVDGVKK